MSQYTLRPVVRVVLVYAVAAALWIVVTDQALMQFAPDWEWAQTGKGLAFVAATSALLFMLLRAELLKQTQAVEALHESEARYRLISENASDVIWLLDLASRRFTYVSPSVQRLRGYTPEEVLAQDLQSAFTPESYRLVVEELPQRIAAFVAGDLSMRFRLNRADQPCKDGSIVTTEVATTLLVDQEGRVQTILGVTRDITERRLAEQELQTSRERYGNILDNMLEGCQILDRDWYYLYVNEAAAKHSRRAREELLGRTMMEVNPGIEQTPLFPALRRCMDERVPVRLVNELTYPDGSSRWFELSIQPVPEGIFILSSDITERRQAEEALRDSEARYRQLFNNVPIGLYRTAFDGRIIEVNPALAQMLGYSDPGSLSGVYATDFYVNLEDRARQQAALAEQGVIVEYEMPLRRRDGTIIWVVDSMRISQGEGGEVLYYEGALRDVTERKRAEGALREAQSHYRTLFEQSADAIFILDLEGRLVDANQRATEMLGYTREEIPTLSMRDVSAQRGESDNVLRRLLSGETLPPYERLFWKKNGELVPVELHVTVIHDPEGRPFRVQSIARDITERKRAEEILRQERDRAQQYLDVAGAMFVAIDADQTISLVNRKACQVLGYTEQELLGKNWFDTCLPERVRGEIKSVFDGLMTGEVEPLEYFENPIRTAGGEERVIAWHSVVLRDAAGHITGTLSSGEDITERRQAEKALQEQLHFLQQLIDAIPVPIFYKGVDGRYLGCNRAFGERVGYPKEEIIGKTLYDLFEELHAEVTHELDERLFREGGTQVYEARVEHPDGSTRDFVHHKATFVDINGELAGLVGIMFDVTERKQAEESLQQRAIQLSLINSIGRRVAALLDLDDLLDAAARLVQKNFDYPHVAIFIRDHGTGDLLMKARSGTYTSRFPPHHRLKEGQGIVGWVAQHGKKLLANDVSKEPRFHNPFDEEVIRAELATPIVVGTTVVGVLDVQSQEVNAFDESDLLVLETLADQIGSAICNAQLFSQIEQRTAYLAALNDASNRVSRWGLDLNGVLQAIVTVLVEKMDVALARLWLADKTGEELILRASAGLHNHLDGEHGRLRVADYPGYVGKVVKERKPVLVNRIQEDGQFNREWAEEHGLTSFACYPLYKNDHLIAVLAIFSTQPLDEAILDMLGSFANQAAIAIENAQLYEELEEYSNILEQAVAERTAELRQSKERVEAILNYSPDPLLLLKPSGAIEAANPAFQRVFGYHADDLYGQPPTRLVVAGSADALQRALGEVIDKREMARLELIAQRRDDTTFDADVALAPIEGGGNLLGVVCNVRDISLLKEVARMKDAFVSNVSHELRTPITSLRLNHRLIIMDPEKSAVYLDRLGREIDRLNILIEDLLRLSRLDQERVTLDLKPVDLNMLVAQYINDRGPLAESKQLTLSFEAGADLSLVEADEGLIGQVLSILLTNAFNYTPAGGRVTVSTRSGQFDDKQWAGFSVSDTGPGVASDDLSHLFERFFRGKAGRESGVPGTGLGLAIAQEIVARHLGRIEVESEGVPGKGTTFTVWLPTKE